MPAKQKTAKTDAERLLLVSPELGEILTAIILRVRAGKAALPLVAAYDVFEQTWSPPIRSGRGKVEFQRLIHKTVRTSAHV
ncbi:hypothetical protein [Pseudofrankia sp. BMG5.36]|uniref:hypothetical protein n=1 Tax=Pseudofrankia sp. BMG5.36 TaxID=1834512 RepID=UPI0008D980FA|nr:hypothetical protein [Pseudofrankia sp. BMG5.36]OHV43686.1 hypothetical protein BCD48_27300 [Pseudofrankia sp. BMG5.36]